MRPGLAIQWVLLGAALALAGCSGQQSVLAPGSGEAARLAHLSWLLFAGGAFILALMVVAIGLAMLGPQRARTILARPSMIVGGGLIFPMVTLAALLGYGFVLMVAGVIPSSVAGAAMRVSMVGERWWWRVIYIDDDGRRIASANELTIPVGRPVRIELTTADVIHSFWVPSLAGKVDMIPGRTNITTISAETPGRFRGQCAEYCGGAHALMSFFVVALPPADFEVWLNNVQAPAAPPSSPEALRGQRLFLAKGCGACHAIRGTSAKGEIGPDLTHVGGRMTLAAATLPNSHAAMVRWIAFNQQIKPENLMPPFLSLEPSELAAIATYLGGLK